MGVIEKPAQPGVGHRLVKATGEATDTLDGPRQAGCLQGVIGAAGRAGCVHEQLERGASAHAVQGDVSRRLQGACGLHGVVAREAASRRCRSASVMSPRAKARCPVEQASS